MQNVGAGSFNFDTFKLAYDSDPRLKSLVTNFDKNKIELKQDATDDLSQSQTDPSADNTVSNMAKSATDLGSSGL